MNIEFKKNRTFTDQSFTDYTEIKVVFKIKIIAFNIENEKKCLFLDVF